MCRLPRSRRCPPFRLRASGTRRRSPGSARSSAPRLRRTARLKAGRPRKPPLRADAPVRAARSPAPFDVITTGRAVVDLYPQQHGVGLADVETFAKSLGGSPTNVAVQAARLGSKTAVVTKVGADAFGEFVRSALRRFGVEPRWVGTDPTARTSIAFCEIHPPDHFPLLFYREPHPPDLNLTPADFNMPTVRDARVLWTTGTGLSAEPSRDTVLRVLAERAAVRHAGRRPVTIHDIDHRAALWRSPGEVVSWSLRALEHATAVVGNAEEVELLVGQSDPLAASRALLACGVELAIVKLGAEGVTGRTRERVI